MRSETTYYAFDETEFDDEVECEAYEEELKFKLLNNFKFFDDAGNPYAAPNFIKDVDLLDYIENAYDNASFVWIKDPSMSRWMDSYFGFYIPSEPGLYYWDNDTSRWKSAQSFLNIANAIQEIEKTTKEE